MPSIYVLASSTSTTQSSRPYGYEALAVNEECVRRNPSFAYDLPSDVSQGYTISVFVV